MERKSQIPTFRRMWKGLTNAFKKSSTQIPSPPTSDEVDPTRASSFGSSKYRCSLFPGTLGKNKIKRRKATKAAYKSRRLNVLHAA